MVHYVYSGDTRRQIETQKDVRLWLAGVASVPLGDTVTVSEAVRVMADSAEYHFVELNDSIAYHREKQDRFAQAFERFCYCDKGPGTDGPEEECLLHGRPEAAAEFLARQMAELEAAAAESERQLSEARETIAILGDPETMKAIEEGQQDLPRP